MYGTPDGAPTDMMQELEDEIENDKDFSQKDCKFSQWIVDALSGNMNI